MLRARKPASSRATKFNTESTANLAALTKNQTLGLGKRIRFLAVASPDDCRRSSIGAVQTFRLPSNQGDPMVTLCYE
jgi:hypothetical protein